MGSLTRILIENLYKRSKEQSKNGLYDGDAFLLYNAACEIERLSRDSDDKACTNVAEPPEEGFWPMPHFECSVCGKHYVTSDYVYFCPSCGRRVVQP